MKHILIVCSLLQVFSQSKINLSRYYAKAIIVTDPSRSDKVEGEIYFQQTEGEDIQINGQINGLSDGPHGFHVHESGNIEKSCTDALAHYNPQKVQHAGPDDAERHAGDLGNIDSLNQVATVNKRDNQIKIYGEQSIIGRAVVVHELVDDLGKGGQTDSNTTGHAGSRLACGRIFKVDSLDKKFTQSSGHLIIMLAILVLEIFAVVTM